MKKLIVFACLVLGLTRWDVLAQCNLPAPPADVFTEEVPLFCEGIDGYCSQLPPQYTLMDLPYCPVGQFAVHNAQLLRFVAGSEYILLQLIPSNCTFLPEGSGIQAAVYQGHPFYEGGWPVALFCGEGEQEDIFLGGNYEVGKTYHLLIDGWAGSVCDYEIYVAAGTTIAPPIEEPPASLSGPSEVCDGQEASFSTEVFGACDYTWSVNGGSLLAGDGSNEITVEVSDAANFSICVAANNACYETEENCFDFMEGIVSVTDTAFTESICEGSSFLFGGNHLSMEGTYVDTMENGCETLIATLTLEVEEGTETEETAEICEGECIDWYSGELCEAGTYEHILTAANGCDSVIVLLLEWAAPIETLQEAAICQGDSLEWNDVYYTDPGTYTEIFEASNGCDSIAILELDWAPEYFIEVDGEFCQGDSYYFDGNIYDSPGEYPHYYLTQAGCDSVVLLHLSMILGPFSNLADTICAGDSLQVGDWYLADEGLYHVFIPQPIGCDSLVQVYLTVLDSSTTTIDTVLEMGNSYNGIVINQDTAITEVYTASNGCDSIVTVNIILPLVGVETLATDFSMQAFPNPVKERLYLNFGITRTVELEVKLFNLQGQCLPQFTRYQEYGRGTHQLSLMLGDLPSGAYLLAVQSERNRMVQKVIVD